MQYRQFGSAIVAGVLLAVSVIGCAPKSAPPPQVGDSGLKIHNEPNNRMSSEQWEVYQPAERSGMASVVAVARNASASVLCDGKGGLSIQIDSHDGRELKNPSLKVTFDQGVAADYPWHSNTEEGWGFILLDSQKDYAPIIGELKQREILEAVVSESGKEWHRYQFTLAKADEAIDYVVKLCGKSS